MKVIFYGPKLEVMPFFERFLSWVKSSFSLPFEDTMLRLQTRIFFHHFREMVNRNCALCLAYKLQIPS